MIILDTNILRSFELQSPKAELLRAIKTAGTEGVAVPWAALEELAGQRARTYHLAHEKAEAALRALAKSAPTGTSGFIPPLNHDQVLEYWRQKYLEIVDVVPTSVNALQQATTREAAALPPCKAVDILNEDGKVTKTIKTGGRDTAIWLSAVEYATDHPTETVYFVSENIKDFGRGDSYKYPMDKDVEYLGDRFVHLLKLEDILPKFSEEIEAPESDLDSALRAQVNLGAIADETRFGAPLRPSRHQTGWRRFRCTQLEEPTEAELPEGIAEVWLGAPNVSFASVRDAKAYRIGSHVWCTAWVTWLLSGHALLNRTLDIAEVGCAWETRVLVSLTDSTSKLNILRSNAPRATSAQEADNLPEVDLLILPNYIAELDDRIRRNRMSRYVRRYVDQASTAEEALEIMLGVARLSPLPLPTVEVEGWVEPDEE
ncbi:PIN domain-containing protein [Streptomyces hydrogenans]|uniref:PIN domain-containing protein n=1 Tax=Streptomyces hydrogenans TaxID=1873719 RepID=UPI0036968EE8